MPHLEIVAFSSYKRRFIVDAPINWREEGEYKLNSNRNKTAYQVYYSNFLFKLEDRTNPEKNIILGLANQRAPGEEEDDDGEIEEPTTPNNAAIRLRINEIWRDLPQRNKIFWQERANILNKRPVVGLMVRVYPWMNNDFIKQCLRKDWIAVWTILQNMVQQKVSKKYDNSKLLRIYPKKNIIMRNLV